MKVYIAAPYADAALVRIVKGKLEDLGAEVLASWAVEAVGPEDLEAMGAAARRAAIDKNDRELQAADVLLVLAREGSGGAMFGEARLAIECGALVIWAGRRTLDAYRESVLRVADANEGAQVVAELVAAGDGAIDAFVALTAMQEERA